MDKGKDGNRSNKVLPLLLEYSLRAGKASRNAEIVPEIESLRTEYKASSSGAFAKEQEQSDQAAKVAYIKAIEPLIDEYLKKERLAATNVNQDIAMLRSMCLELVELESPEETRWMNQRLHGVTLELREEGKLKSFATLQDCVAAVQRDLDSFRQRQIK